MIARYALFEGEIRAGVAAEFRSAVPEELVPTWRAFPGAVAVRVTFSDACDEGAPGFPLILAVHHPDRAALDQALASPERQAGHAATHREVPRFFDGRIHHHVTAAKSHRGLKRYGCNRRENAEW